MKYGTIINTKKYRDGKLIINESVCEERVRIMKIADFDTIVSNMHSKHAISSGYGAWVEKQKDGKMYVVKRWLVEE